MKLERSHSFSAQQQLGSQQISSQQDSGAQTQQGSAVALAQQQKSWQNLNGLVSNNTNNDNDSRNNSNQKTQKSNTVDDALHTNASNPQYPAWNVQNESDNQQYMMTWPWQTSINNITPLSPAMNQSASPYAFPDVEGQLYESTNIGGQKPASVELFQGVMMRPTPVTKPTALSKHHSSLEFYINPASTNIDCNNDIAAAEKPDTVPARHARKSKPGSKQTSLEIYEEFVKTNPDNTGLDVTGILGTKCYEKWIKSRRTKPANGPEAFRKTLVSYVTCADKASRPFRPEVERALLRLLRQKRTWPCFENMLDPITQKPLRIGSNGLRCTGYHEAREVEALEQSGMFNRKRTHSYLQVQMQQQLQNQQLQHHMQQQQLQRKQHQNERSGHQPQFVQLSQAYHMINPQQFANTTEPANKRIKT